MLQKIKDPASCLSHLVGAVLALCCTIVLLAKSYPLGGRYIFAFTLFGVCLTLLYTASSAYHMFRLGTRGTNILRRIDHTMIFFLIAGTYTPVCLIPLRGPWGWGILAAVWGFALAGTCMKLFWLQAPRLLSTVIYVVMGWLVLIAFFPLVQSISTVALGLLVAGGLSYTLGAIIYAFKWPPFIASGFGFHEIFHVAVLLGSSFHVLFMFELFPN